MEINLSILPILLILAYQDFTKYSVSLLWLIILIVLQFIIGVYTIGFESILLNVVINISITLFQLIILMLYFKIKKTTRNESFINNVLGLGDIIYFIFLSVAFSPINYLFFLITSLILTLVIHLILMNRHEKIALIGYLSILYSLVIALGFNTQNDIYFQSLLIEQ